MPPEPPAFLLDRSLGRYVVADAVHEAGYECVTLAEFLGSEDAAQESQDVDWMRDAAEDNFVILTRDGQLYIRPHERQVVGACLHRVFWLGPKKGPGSAWGDRFTQHHQAIAEWSMTDGPYVVKVYADGLQLAWQREPRARKGGRWTQPHG